MAGTELKKLPIGVSDFECIRRYDSYYADKTQLITKLLDNVHPKGAILFTRPRRFSKSLALDMLRCFFDCQAKEKNRPLFDGLAISQSAKHMAEQGIYPVIRLSFNGKKYSDCFGFTQDEVTEMVAFYGKLDKLAEIKDWYDGYRFGQRDIYNPWSVLNYFKHGCEPQAHWMDTSSNDLIIEFLRSLQEQQRKQIMALYRGGTVEASVDTAVSYQQLQICRELLSNGEQKQSDACVK